MKNKNISSKIVHSNIRNFTIGDKIYVKTDNVESTIIGIEKIKNDLDEDEIRLYHTIKDIDDEHLTSALLTKDLIQDDYYRVIQDFHQVRIKLKNFVVIPIIIKITCDLNEYTITTNPNEDDIIVIGKLKDMPLFVISYSIVRPDINNGKPVIGLTTILESQLV